MDKAMASARQIILSYYNNILFEKGVITEEEKNKMNYLISKDCRKVQDKKGKQSLI